MPIIRFLLLQHCQLLVLLPTAATTQVEPDPLSASLSAAIVWNCSTNHFRPAIKPGPTSQLFFSPRNPSSSLSSLPQRPFDPSPCYPNPIAPIAAAEPLISASIKQQVDTIVRNRHGGLLSSLTGQPGWPSTPLASHLRSRHIRIAGPSALGKRGFNSEHEMSIPGPVCAWCRCHLDAPVLPWRHGLSHEYKKVHVLP